MWTSRLAAASILLLILLLGTVTSFGFYRFPNQVQPRIPLSGTPELGSAFSGTAALQQSARESIQRVPALSGVSYPHGSVARSAGNAFGPLNNVGCGATCDMTYHTKNAPVMLQPANYLIFWLPSNYHFDNATIDPGATSPSDSKYETLIQRYFQDVGNSNFYNILNQYNGSGLTTSLGGTWVDTSAFPGGGGALGNGLTETDVQNEILSGMTSNPSWTSNNGNNEFFVFEPYKVFTTTDGTSFCAHHTFFTSGGTPIIYSNMQDDGSLGCLTTAYNPSLVRAGPNSDPFADSEISTISHEQFESVSDPKLNAWYYQNLGGEIGDECNGYYGPGASSVEPDGSNIYMNGHPYIVQFEWSNSNHGCVLDLTGPPVQATVNVYPSSGSSTSPDSYFALAYIEAGLPTIVPQANFHGSQVVVWIDRGTQLTLLQGPAVLQQNEQWCLVISSGSCSSQQFSFAAGTGGAFTYFYYDVLKEDPSFLILGGGSASAPSFSYLAAPSSPTTTDSPVTTSLTLSSTPQTLWILRGSSWSATTILASSTSTERWASQGSGVVSSSGSLVVSYHHQWFINNFGLKIIGGPPFGSYTLPTVTYSYLGLPVTGDVPLPAVWVDAGSTWSATNPLGGSSMQERWLSASPIGTVTSAGTIYISYYHQYSQSTAYSLVGGGSPSAPSLSFMSLGASVSMPLSTSSQTFWMDAVIGSASVPTLLPGSTLSERWITSMTMWTISGPNLVPSAISYQHQYFVSFTVSPAGTGSVTANNNASLTSGFFNAGGTVSLSAAATQGYRFSSWSTTGTTPFASSASPATNTIIGSPAVITANFATGLPVAFSAIIVVILLTAIVAILTLRRRGLLTRKPSPI